MTASSSERSASGTSARSTHHPSRSFYACIPLFVAVPIVIGLIFTSAGIPIIWSAFGLGALGWWIALLLRGPLALSLKRRPKESAQLIIGLSSGPFEEAVRWIILLLTAQSLPWAASLGQGWAAIEVLFTIVNGIVLTQLLRRDDDKSREVKAILEAQGQLHASPLWGVIERIFASCFHIGATLLVAANPLLVLVMIPAHSLLNFAAASLMRRSLILAELMVAVIGGATLSLGLLAFS
ncbi:YhfC family intramembrane metalloprotease [Brevibacillus humidisoli]|uniref:YhfC family glutamic-type intramembrane protease n=1 Tax=Brevibacillus humidisoli TaxID=2895522 RepID=UPI001E5BEF2F|nr:YhfC family glutamic-type intramembrane protease [Brevibacillus humidisoli]UFJ39852.1 YhfC family intramembrane metalloprotease [Brevibacillus humidisoli]